jgi:hypothetical protein
MKPIRLQHETGKAVTLFAGDRLLCRYVYAPDTAAKESPKPYFHPVNSLAGDTLTNFRPNDHPWHHALCFTLNNVSGANFWGGPTCLQDGYKWRDDHGAQQHLEWTRLEARGAAASLDHRLAWRRLEETLFDEARSIEITVDETAQAWSMHWRSRLTNVSGARCRWATRPPTAASRARIIPACSFAARANCSTTTSTRRSGSPPRAAARASRPCTARPCAGWNGTASWTPRCIASSFVLRTTPAR